MRQIWISKAGPPETLLLKEAPDPNPRAGEARIRVEVSGVNFADVMGRWAFTRILPKIPVVPGYEVAGRVDAVGEGVDPAWIGRKVFALTRFGGYADVVCSPTGRIFARARRHVRRGRRRDFHSTISPPGNSLSSWAASRPAKRCWSIPLAAGVGVAATQIAKHIGAKVIGTASAAKHQELRALGVDHLIDYRDRRLRKAHARDYPRPRRRTYPRPGRRRVAQEGLQASGAHRPAWNVRRLVGRHQQDRGNAWDDVDGCPDALASIQSALLDEREQGCLGVNMGHMWDEADRTAAWMKSAHTPLGARRHQASDRADVQL